MAQALWVQKFLAIKPVNLNSKLIIGFPACCGKEAVMVMIPNKGLYSLWPCTLATPQPQGWPATCYLSLFSWEDLLLVLVRGSSITAAALFPWLLLTVAVDEAALGAWQSLGGQCISRRALFAKQPCPVGEQLEQRLDTALGWGGKQQL